MQLKNLSPNQKNPRKSTKESLSALKDGLDKFGDLGGFVFNRRSQTLISGHQRSKVLPPSSEIKIEITYDIPTKAMTVAEGYFVIEGERFKYREVDADKKWETEAMLAANNHAGRFDQDIFKELVIDVPNIDLKISGFDDLSIKEFNIPRIAEDGTVIYPQDDNSVTGNCDPDEVPEVIEVKAKMGEIYQLGNHRLMCGDSTKLEEVEKLMNGEKADITFSSPPYNLGNNSKLRSYNGDGKDSVYNQKSDHKSQEEYLLFMILWTKLAIKFSTTVFCNVQLLAGNKIVIPKYWMEFHDNLIDLMVWDKEYTQPSFAPRVLNSVFEFIFIFTNEKNPKRSIKTGTAFRGTLKNIFRLNPIRGGKDEFQKTHGAVFPVAFAEYFINNFSENSVIDLFGGSGSTLIACEKTNRKCFMMELDPHYIDVIIARWEKFTGKRAVLIHPEIK